MSLSQNSLIFNSTDNNLSFSFLYYLFSFWPCTLVISCLLASAVLTVVRVYLAKKDFEGFLFLPLYITCRQSAQVVWHPQLWRCFSCVCFSPLVLTSVLRRKGGVHVYWLRLTGQCRDRIRRFFLWAPDVVLETKYRMAAIDAQKMMWSRNHRSEGGGGWSEKSSSQLSSFRQNMYERQF